MSWSPCYLLKRCWLKQESQSEDCVKAVPTGAVQVTVDHESYVEHRSDAQLVYYITGYVARRHVLPTHCEDCTTAKQMS